MRPKPGPKSRKTPLRGFIPETAWEPPAYLSERATAEYRRLVGILDDMGRLGVSDPRLVELYAVNYDLAQTAYETLLADGLTITSDRGNVSKHPLLEAVNAATVRVKAISTALGITPTPAELSRLESPSAPPGEEDGWGSLLNFGHGG